MLSTNINHLSQMVLKKKIFKYFFMYFYGLNLGLLVRAIFEPGTFI